MSLVAKEVYDLFKFTDEDLRTPNSLMMALLKGSLSGNNPTAQLHPLGS